MQVPSNLVMNAIPYPRLFISSVVVTWGLVSGLTALCNSFGHLVVCRFFLGFVEAVRSHGNPWLTGHSHALIFCRRSTPARSITSPDGIPEKRLDYG